jgi:hypothetical protein
MLMMVGTFSVLEERPVFLDEAVHARPLQADGVEHAAGDFGGARRGIAGHGIQPDALDRDRAELVQVNQPRIFRAVAERAGGDRHGILHVSLPILTDKFNFEP